MDVPAISRIGVEVNIKMLEKVTVNKKDFLDCRDRACPVRICSIKRKFKIYLVKKTNRKDKPFPYKNLNIINRRLLLIKLERWMFQPNQGLVLK
jgi:hypothetical protein